MAKITDRQARNIKPESKAIPTGVTGFALVPTSKAGVGRWRLRYVSPTTGKRRDYSMGSYPDVGVAVALKQAREARELIAEGLDPIEHRQSAQRIPTFEQAARTRWAEIKHRFKSEITVQNWLSSMEMHVFPHIGDRKVDTLRPRDFARVLQPLYDKYKDTNRKVHQRCDEVMKWAWAHELILGNPLDAVEPLLVKQETTTVHHPSMPWADVWRFIKEHLSGKHRTGAKACLLFLILTATRSGEARGARWSEIDFDNRIWVIPAERMKQTREHRIPLSDAAMALLLEQKEYGLHPELVFPSARAKTELSDMALLNILRKAKAKSDVKGRTATVHGFRSSFRNWAADNNYSTDVAERALAHSIGDQTRAAYERTDRLEARIAMMQAWADVIMTERDNVINLVEHKAG